MNKGEVVKDSENNIYLKITGKPIDKDNPVYFKIECYNTEPIGKIVKLSKGNLLINLKGE